MKSFIAVLSFIVSIHAFVPASASSASNFDAADYPVGPNPELTPGSLCDRPSEHRYPENIDYCSRSVDTSLKRRIIRQYDQELGYRIGKMNRQDFKIDHYIPLCAGGSNRADNLWPQHKTVYTVTDPLEQILCEKMAQGKLLQADAVALIKEAKNDLSKVEGILEHLDTL